MAIVIFGGDRLGKIPQLLQEHGFKLVEHITGRKKSHQRVEIPQAAQGVLVFTDYLNHKTADEVKAAAKRKGIKAVFVRRSWSELSRVLATLQSLGTER